MMTFHDLFTLLLLIFAALYWAHVLTKTHGPGNLFGWLREHLPHGGLLTCPYCLVFWLSLAFYLLWLSPPLQPVIVISAIAGGAAALARYVGLWG